MGGRSVPRISNPCSVAPDGTLHAPLFGFQGGGAVYVKNGMATLTNTHVYSSYSGSDVCSPSALLPGFGLDSSSITPVERYALRFLACRAVASKLKTMQWLTLKAAVSMTTPLLLCACSFEYLTELASITR